MLSLLNTSRIHLNDEDWFERGHEPIDQGKTNEHDDKNGSLAMHHFSWPVLLFLLSFNFAPHILKKKVLKMHKQIEKCARSPIHYPCTAKLDQQIGGMCMLLNRFCNPYGAQ